MAADATIYGHPGGKDRQAQEAEALGQGGARALAGWAEVRGAARYQGMKVKEALQKVVALRNKLEETRNQRTRQEQRIVEITSEHGRIRENMQRLQQNSELYNRYVKKLDQQETELEGIRRTIENVKAMEEEQRRELNSYLMGLDLA